MANHRSKSCIKVTRNRHERPDIQPARNGRSTMRCGTFLQSEPSSKSESCVALSIIDPSQIGGHVKRPLSKRFEYKARPVPSHIRILMRSARFGRKMKRSPQKGSLRSISLTNIARESMPRRKSTGLDATRMRRPDRTLIIVSPVPRSTQCEGLIHRCGHLRECERRPFRFRSPVHHSQSAAVLVFQARSSQARMPGCFAQRLGAVHLPSLGGAIRIPSRGLYHGASQRRTHGFPARGSLQRSSLFRLRSNAAGGRCSPSSGTRLFHPWPLAHAYLCDYSHRSPFP